MNNNDLREMISSNMLGAHAYYLLGLVQTGVDIEYDEHFKDPEVLLEAFKTLVDFGVLVVDPGVVNP